MDLGARTIVIDNCQKATVKVIASLANKWLKHLQNQNKKVAASASIEASSHMDESLKLARLQIKYQQKIVTLLEEIRDDLKK